jgi:hypothetical protein
MPGPTLEVAPRGRQTIVSDEVRTDEGRRTTRICRPRSGLKSTTVRPNDPPGATRSGPSSRTIGPAVCAEATCAGTNEPSDTKSPTETAPTRSRRIVKGVLRCRMMEPFIGPRWLFSRYETIPARNVGSMTYRRMSHACHRHQRRFQSRPPQPRSDAALWLAPGIRKQPLLRCWLRPAPSSASGFPGSKERSDCRVSRPHTRRCTSPLP